MTATGARFERTRRDRCTDSETARKRLTFAKASIFWAAYVRERKSTATAFKRII
jgi:hypothetical protein